MALPAHANLRTFFVLCPASLTVVFQRTSSFHPSREHLPSRTMIQEPETTQQTKPGGSAGAGVPKILVATDFSRTSERALEHALSLARHYNSRIFLTHVIPVGLIWLLTLLKLP